MKNIKDVSTETTQIVYETTNYDAISHLNYNRDYTQERVNKVRKSINKTLKSGKKVGQREPAILTSTGKIISGQARFKLEQLIPFKFIIDDYENDNDTLDCIEIHHTQSTFTLSECLETYYFKDLIIYGLDK